MTILNYSKAYLILTLFSIPYSMQQTLSYDNLLLVKSTNNLVNTNAVYNISNEGRERLKIFLNETIDCPVGLGLTSVQPLCYRRITLDRYNYLCCDEENNFSALYLYTLKLERKETRYLFSVLKENTKESTGLVFLHTQGTSRNNKHRGFHIIQKEELGQLKRFVEQAIQCPDFMGRIINVPNCYKRIVYSPYYVCCNLENEPTSVKIHSIVLDKSQEIIALRKILNDEQYP